MRSGADGEGGRAVSEWEAAEAHLPQACSVLFSATPAAPALPCGPLPTSFCPNSSSQSQSPHPVPFPPPPFSSPQSHSDPFSHRTSRFIQLPSRRTFPPLSPAGLRPGPGRSDPRTPSLGPGPLLTSQTSAPETEPERYTGTGNPPTALRPAVATATAAATPRSPPRDRGGPGHRPAQPQWPLSRRLSACAAEPQGRPAASPGSFRFPS